MAAGGHPARDHAPQWAHGRNHRSPADPIPPTVGSIRTQSAGHSWPVRPTWSVNQWGNHGGSGVWDGELPWAWCWALSHPRCLTSRWVSPQAGIRAVPPGTPRRSWWTSRHSRSCGTFSPESGDLSTFRVARQELAIRIFVRNRRSGMSPDEWVTGGFVGSDDRGQNRRLMAARHCGQRHRLL